MSKQELTGKPLHDVNKLVYLANEYPKKTMQQLAQLLEMSPLDINNAIWRAEDLGYLVIDAETQNFTVDTVPKKWEFGEEIETLRESLIYYFNHLARNENDIEETYLSNLTMGYPAHDVMLTLKQLVNERVLASYQLSEKVEVPNPSKKARGKGAKPEIREDVYTFFSLWENSEQQWGKKQFKNAANLK